MNYLLYKDEFLSFLVHIFHEIVPKFKNVEFKGEAVFTYTNFNNGVNFINTSFNKDANLNYA